MRKQRNPSLGQMVKEVTEAGFISMWNTPSIGAPTVMRTAWTNDHVVSDNNNFFAWIRIN